MTAGKDGEIHIEKDVDDLDTDAEILIENKYKDEVILHLYNLCQGFRCKHPVLKGEIDPTQIILHFILTKNVFLLENRSIAIF